MFASHGSQLLRSNAHREPVEDGDIPSPLVYVPEWHTVAPRFPEARRPASAAMVDQGVGIAPAGRRSEIKIWKKSRTGMWNICWA
jgi:hypothetical protein